MWKKVYYCIEVFSYKFLKRRFGQFLLNCICNYARPLKRKKNHEGDKAIIFANFYFESNMRRRTWMHAWIFSLSNSLRFLGAGETQHLIMQKVHGYIFTISKRSWIWALLSKTALLGANTKKEGTRPSKLAWENFNTGLSSWLVSKLTAIQSLGLSFRALLQLTHSYFAEYLDYSGIKYWNRKCFAWSRNAYSSRHILLIISRLVFQIQNENK